jgi:hypothetical protein
VAKEYSNPILIDLKNVTSFSKDVALSLPAGVVAGSQRVVVSAIGMLKENVKIFTNIRIEN